MRLPNRFLVTYKGVECQFEIEMVNCLLPSVKIYCEECSQVHAFKSETLTHLSWEFDTLEEVENI